jgi:hypothetical protein
MSRLRGRRGHDGLTNFLNSRQKMNKIKGDIAWPITAADLPLRAVKLIRFFQAQ